MFVVRAI
jgi:hypothetical protein